MSEHNRVVVITGAAEGIGKSLAESYLDDGDTVVAVDINADRLEAMARDVDSRPGTVVPIQADVSDPEAVEDLAASVFERFGRVDLLVNNAGVESVGYLWEISPETWGKVQGVNSDGVFYAVRSFVPRMGEQAGPARIVNVSSVAAVTNSPRNGAYGVSKHAVRALTEILYVECQEKYPNIRVSVVCPAAVDSRIFQDALTEGAASSEDSREELTAMQKYLSEYGISVDEAARRIRQGIDSGEFWISTHPERFAELASRRAVFLSEQRTPAPNIAEERT